MPALVIDGHPNPDSLCAEIARRYVAAHPDAVLLAVRDLDFDLVMRHGYREEQEWEPDLRRAAELVEAADHVVVVTPVWWASTPALLKGFFDRLLLPGWAYQFQPGKLGLQTRLLTGRTGRLIVTSDSPRWWLPLIGDSTVKQVRGEVMRFVGISPVSLTRFTSVRLSDAAQRAAWLESVGDLARRDARPSRRRRAARPSTALALG